MTPTQHAAVLALLDGFKETCGEDVREAMKLAMRAVFPADVAARMERADELFATLDKAHEAADQQDCGYCGSRHGNGRELSCTDCDWFSTARRLLRELSPPASPSGQSTHQPREETPPEFACVTCRVDLRESVGCDLRRSGACHGTPSALSPGNGPTKSS